jgi:hypothetical protein
MNILRDEELDGVSQEQVDILDEVEEVVPRSVLWSRLVIREVALDYTRRREFFIVLAIL